MNPLREDSLVRAGSGYCFGGWIPPALPRRSWVKFGTDRACESANEEGEPPYSITFDASGVDGTVLTFLVPEGGAHVDLRAYDARGRQVRDLVHGSLGIGERVVRWNGRADDGRRLVSGVYFLRLSIDGRVSTTRIVRIR